MEPSASPLMIATVITGFALVVLDRLVCSEGFLRAAERVLRRLQPIISANQADRYGVVVVGLLCLSAYVDRVPPGWLFTTFMLTLAATLYLYASAAQTLSARSPNIGP